jgi:hypothetical protein
LGGEDEVALALFFAGEDCAGAGAEDEVVYVKGAAGLDLYMLDGLRCRREEEGKALREDAEGDEGGRGKGERCRGQRVRAGGMEAYSKIESDLCILPLDIGVEAGFLVGGEFVGEGSGGDESREEGEEGEEVG